MAVVCFDAVFFLDALEWCDEVWCELDFEVCVGEWCELLIEWCEGWRVLVLVGCRLVVEGCLGRCVLVESRDSVADECFDREVTVTVCTGTRVVVRREKTMTVDGTMPSTEEAASAPGGGEKAAVTSVMLTSDMMRGEKNKFPNGPACREGYMNGTSKATATREVVG